MSIRRTIQSLLDDEQKQAEFQRSPEAFFAEQGMDDLPGELIGTSFVHYSDTAPIEHGDAVAGIATHFSAVPFDPDDLPELDGADPFATLGSVAADLPPPDDLGSSDEPADPETPPDDSGPSDPHGLDDDTATGNELHNEHDDSARPDPDADLLEEGEFGMGSDDDGPTEILGEIHGGGPLDPGADDPFFDDETVTERGVVGIERPIHAEEPNLAPSETVEPYESFTADLVEEFVDVDPSDLDLDDF